MRKFERAQRNITETLGQQYAFLVNSINRQNALLSYGAMKLQELRDDVKSLEEITQITPNECYGRHNNN